MIIQGATLTGVTVTDASPTTANLVLYYNPANTASYSGSGTTINSLAPTNLTGTMTSITYTSPYFSYNGSSSKVAVADNSILEPSTGNWTMEVWFNASATVGSTVLLGKFDNGGGSAQVSYSIRTSGTGLFAQMGNGSSVVNSTSYTFGSNTWYQVVYVWSTSPTKNLVTYINGSSIGTVTHTFTSLLNSVNPLYLGAYNGGEYNQWFNGKIGVTRLYNAALSSSQVLYNYNITKGAYGL